MHSTGFGLVYEASAAAEVGRADPAASDSVHRLSTGCPRRRPAGRCPTSRSGSILPARLAMRQARFLSLGSPHARSRDELRQRLGPHAPLLSCRSARVRGLLLYRTGLWVWAAKPTPAYRTNPTAPALPPLRPAWPQPLPRRPLRLRYYAGCGGDGGGAERRVKRLGNTSLCALPNYWKLHFRSLALLLNPDHLLGQSVA